MPFTVEERKELIAIKGIGNTFVTRLEEMGLDTIEKLANSSWDFIIEKGAKLMGSSCYKTVHKHAKPQKKPFIGRKKNYENKTNFLLFGNNIVLNIFYNQSEEVERPRQNRFEFGVFAKS